MGRKKKVLVEDEEFSNEEELEDGVYIKEEEDESDEENSLSAKEIIEDKVLTSEYSSITLTDLERNEAERLSNSLSLFLKDTADVNNNDTNNTTLPTGIDLLDTLAGGGIGTKFNMIVGPPGGGKSALLAKIMSTAQKKFRGKVLNIYLDSEESMSEDRLTELGIKNPKLKPYTDMTIEKVFRIIEGVCAMKKKDSSLIDCPTIIGWDSIANTNPEAAAEAASPNEITGLKARLLSFYLPKYVSKLNKYNISLIAVNQLRDKIDMGMNKKPADLKYLFDQEIPGGKAMKFNAFHLIHIKPGKSIEGEYGFDGIKVNCKFVKNKLFTPNIDFTMIFSFQYGYSNFWTNYELLKDTKRINAGAWCSLVQYPEKKFRQYQALEFYHNDEQFKKVFDGEVLEVLKTEYIEKYKNNTIESDTIIG